MYQILIPTLTFLAVVGIGGGVLITRASRQRELRARICGNSASSPGPDRIYSLSGTLEHVGRAMAADQSTSAIREKLVQAGYHGLNAPAIYLGCQLLLAFGGVAVAVPLALAIKLSLILRVCVGFVIVAVFALLPNVVVTMQQRSRRSEVWRHLPDAIDLLEICVSAGIGLDMAWNAVADELRSVSAVLADEMALANLEIHLGMPRSDALRHMAARTGVDEISSLVATLVQSERFGTSIAQALRTYAEAMRDERSQRAEEAAEKLMIKLMFPMVVFIFPVMFVVILGPAAMKLMTMFGGMAR